MISQDAVITGLVVALVGIIVVAAVLLWAMQRGPGAMVPPVPPSLAVAVPPAAPGPLSLADFSQYLNFYETQLTALREQMSRVEADRQAQFDRVEQERRVLFERVDKTDALNKTLGDKLIAVTDRYMALERFTDHILKTLDTTPGGAGWASELRKQDPRNHPPVVNGQ